jgi:hypothetical protein
VPFIAAAQESGPQLSYFRALLGSVADLVNAAIPLMIGIALVIFFWGLIQYIRNPGGGEGHGGGDGKKIMIAGLVGLFIMVSVWGIIRLAQSVFGIQSNQQAGQQVQSPRVPR